ncbi:MAG: amidohydrolase [Candidatus Eremiobacteraeota bacterium]|nr:amidohydrolase [Candidatus Eremiobacteraeota bacterium]
MTTVAVSPELFAETVAVRRDLHAHPELAFEETRTAEIVAARLRALGIEVHAGIGGTGVVGLLTGAQPGPTIMLRADMDALPMPEENDGVPYVSRNAGVTHACGHDAHVAMLLGAAAILRERASEVHGRIAFVFQPAEEGGGGARAMLDDGLIARFAIERAYGLHIVNTAGNALAPSGVFGLRPGPLMAAVDSFDLVVEGMGGHGAMPHRSVDPVVVAADVVGALQRVVSREIDPVEPAVLTIGAINGGTTYNVIPPRVALKGTVRTFTDATRDTMEARVQRIAEHTCAAANATCSLQWHPSYPVTVNDPAEAAFVTAVLTAEFGAARVRETAPVMGSEDFSYFAQAVPACFYFLGAGDATHAFPNHHPAFDIDENAMKSGIAAHVAVALAATSSLRR